MVSLNCCLVSDMWTIQQLWGRFDKWYELLTPLHGCLLVLPLGICRDCREDTFPNKRDSLRRTHNKSKYLGFLPPRCIVVCVLQMPYLRSVFNREEGFLDVTRFCGCQILCIAVCLCEEYGNIVTRSSVPGLSGFTIQIMGVPWERRGFYITRSHKMKSWKFHDWQPFGLALLSRIRLMLSSFSFGVPDDSSRVERPQANIQHEVVKERWTAGSRLPWCIRGKVNRKILPHRYK